MGVSDAGVGAPVVPGVVDVGVPVVSGVVDVGAPVVSGVAGVGAPGVEDVVVPGVAGAVVPGVAGVVVSGVAGAVVPGVAGVVVSGVEGVVVSGVAGVVVPGVAGVVGVSVPGVVGGVGVLAPTPSAGGVTSPPIEVCSGSCTLSVAYAALCKGEQNAISMQKTAKNTTVQMSICIDLFVAALLRMVIIAHSLLGLTGLKTEDYAYIRMYLSVVITPWLWLFRLHYMRRFGK